MVYKDTVLIDKQHIREPDEFVVEYYKENYESFLMFFFHLFILTDPENRVSTIVDTLTNTDCDLVLGAEYNVAPDQALQIVIQNYRHFETSVRRFFGFLDALPNDVTISDIEISTIDALTLMVRIIYDTSTR